MVRNTMSSRLLLCLLWPVLATACALPPGDLDGDLDGDLGGALGESSEQAVSIPAQGSDSTLDIASWNIEWFGNTSLGPDNESLQRDNARDVILGTDFDIWGLAEIVSTNHFASLLDRLPGYDGFLANDASVESGSSFYSSSEQKVAILFKTSVASVQRARLILTQKSFEFAGRPPLEVSMRVSVNGATEDLVVIVLHAKAISDDASWERRLAASVALKEYLDSTYPSQKVIVIGDFNDDVDTSITQGNPSPYENFVDSPASYIFPTQALTLAGLSSTVSHSDMIDHHLATNELMAQYMGGSAEVHFVDELIVNYDDTTSDHFPVLSRYALDGDGGGGGGTAQVMINEIRANEPGSSTAGEFIEIVNVGTGTADLGSWVLFDGVSLRHRFAGGTTLAPGEAVVVFGAASAIPGGVSAVGASTGSLGLNNGGDSVSLVNADGDEVDGITYPSSLASQDGVSMNRSSDGNPDAGFVLHTSLASASSSPGTRASGAPW